MAKNQEVGVRGILANPRAVYCMRREAVPLPGNLSTMLKLLVEEKVIDELFVAMLMTLTHTSGFNVDNSVRIARGDQMESEFLSLERSVSVKSVRVLWDWYRLRLKENGLWIEGLRVILQGGLVFQ